MQIKKLHEGEKGIHLCERQFHSSVEGDLPGSVFDSKQQTAPAVIDRLPAPCLPKCLVVLEVRKICHEAGPSHFV